MDRVARLVFGQRKLQVLTVEPIAPATHAVGPGDEKLPAAAGDRFVGGEPVQQRPAVHFVMAKGAAQLDHHCRLHAMMQSPLFS